MKMRNPFVDEPEYLYLGPHPQEPHFADEAPNLDAAVVAPPPVRETAEQITIRLLKGTLGALLDHLRADLEPVWTSMDPQELGKLKASLQLAAIAANGVLSRLEMPV